MADEIIIETTSTEVVEVGTPGPQGPAGTNGTNGQGVPVGGTTGQVLRKASDANYDTEWATGGGGGVSSWNDLTDKPATFPPSSHTHPTSDIVNFASAAAAAAPVQSVNGSTGAVTVTVPTASSATPSALGVAAAGTSANFARADHVHAMPSPDNVGALAINENLGDLADAETSRINLGLGTAATAASTDFAAASHTHADATTTVAGFLSASDKTKLDGIASGAEVNVQANWTESNSGSDAFIQNKPTLAAIATSGSASDLTTGTVATARLGTGTANSTSFLRGDQTWAVVSGVTTGSVDNAVLRADGTGGSTSQGSAFIIADNATASPNNTVNHASIQATGDTTNVSVSIVPKGTGAFMLQVPNAAAGGGNVRGANAVDFQTSRSAATQVASGEFAVVVSGRNNTASGSDSSCLGGYGNTASGFMAAVVGGRLSTASNDASGVFGSDTSTSSGTRSAVVGGSNNTASGTDSLAAGARAVANRTGMQAFASGLFAANGDAQRIRAVLRCKTTTNAAVEMALDGSTTYLTIPSGKVIFCNIKVVGVKSDGSVVATYERQYAAKNVAGTSSEVYAAVTIGTDNAASTSLEVATVDAGDYIRIRPTGILNETWRWVASVDAVEVAYGA